MFVKGVQGLTSGAEREMIRKMRSFSARKLIITLLIFVFVLGIFLVVVLITQKPKNPSTNTGQTDSTGDFIPNPTITLGALNVTIPTKDPVKELERKARYVEKITKEEKVPIDTAATLITQAEEVYKNATYSISRSQYVLPNGDVFETGRTRFDVVRDDFTLLTEEGDDYHDFKFWIKNPIASYVVVLYEAPFIRNYQTIFKGVDISGEDKNYMRGDYYSFDMRDIEATRKGILLVYPEGTEIDETKLGMPAGPLLAIPLTL